MRSSQEDNNEMSQTLLDMGGMRSYSNRCYLSTEHRGVANAAPSVWSQPVEKHERPDVSPLGLVRSTGDAMVGKTCTTLRFSKNAQIEYDAHADKEYKMSKKRDDSVETRQVRFTRYAC
jgi:hypothetical protein